jgi:hypothetical protein
MMFGPSRSMVVPNLVVLSSIVVKLVEVCIFAALLVVVATGLLVLKLLMMGAAYCFGSLLLRSLSKW